MRVNIDFYRHGVSCANIITPAMWWNASDIMTQATNTDITDAGLSTYGKTSTIAAAGTIQTQYDRVFSSPLVRCVQTAYLQFLFNQGNNHHPAVIETEPSLLELLSFATENQQIKPEAEWFRRINLLGLDISGFVKQNPDEPQKGDLIRFIYQILPQRLMLGDLTATQQNIAVVTHSLLMMRDLLGGGTQGAVPGNNAAIRLVCEYEPDVDTKSYKLTGVFDRTGLGRPFPADYASQLLLLTQCTERLLVPAAVLPPASALGYEVFCNDVMCGGKCLPVTPTSIPSGATRAVEKAYTDAKTTASNFRWYWVVAGLLLLMAIILGVVYMLKRRRAR